MIRCVLVVGDQSSAGGVVVEGISLCSLMGKEMTFVGARVECPACKSTGMIVGVGPRRTNNWLGKTEALDGDLCACRCEPAPVMFASQRSMYHSFDATELREMGFDATGRLLNLPVPLARSVTSDAPASASSEQSAKRTETIEIIISDSRMISSGSQFGHTAFLIDDTEYGRAPKGWDKNSRANYLHRQQVLMARDSWGYVIGVTPVEKAAILEAIEQRMAANAPYSLTSNSCSSNIVDVLAAAGIAVHDPRWSFMDVISPADLMAGLRRSARLVNTHAYPKK